MANTNEEIIDKLNGPKAADSVVDYVRTTRQAIRMLGQAGYYRPLAPIALYTKGCDYSGWSAETLELLKQIATMHKEQTAAWEAEVAKLRATLLGHKAL